MRVPCGGPRSLLPRLSERCKCIERRVEQPAKPDTLTLTKFADAVQTVVPVARANQRQSMNTGAEAGIECTRAVLEQSSDVVGDRRLKEAVVLSRLQTLAFQKWHQLVQHGVISGGADIMGDRVSKPGAIIGDQ